MPELPEVETLCRQLTKVVCGRAILDSTVVDMKLRHLENMAGRRIRSVCRTGKGVNISLDNGQILCLHLRMTGRLLWQSEPVELPHMRWKATFEEGRLALIDPRRFATLSLRDDLAPLCEVIDPLENLPARRFHADAGKRRMPVKSFLLDQRIISGIGNIYACEILHAASIDPWRAANDLSLAEWRKVSQAAKKILLEAIACRGTSISDWRDLFGQPGENQDNLKVYGQEGKVCPRCGGMVRRLKLSGRGTFYCPDCQK